MTCTAADCSRTPIAKGLCPSHYDRLRRYGDLHVSRARIARSFDDHWLSHPISRCWIWMRSRDTHGYGHLNVRGKMVLAHRFSYERWHGPIPPGMQVLHRCDRPACVNPGHLFLGTPKLNSDDKWRKGRGVALVSHEDFQRIQADPRFDRLIAAEIGVSRTTITRIRNGENIWRFTELQNS